jgi:hypothetical protein
LKYMSCRSLAKACLDCNTAPTLHPLPILSPIAQRQQLGVDSQANAQTPSDMNDQLPEPAAESEELLDTRTVPGEIIGAGTFDEPLSPTNP